MSEAWVFLLVAGLAEVKFSESVTTRAGYEKEKGKIILRAAQGGRGVLNLS